MSTFITSLYTVAADLQVFFHLSHWFTYFDFHNWVYSYTYINYYKSKARLKYVKLDYSLNIYLYIKYWYLWKIFKLHRNDMKDIFTLLQNEKNNNWKIIEK